MVLGWFNTHFSCCGVDCSSGGTFHSKSQSTTTLTPTPTPLIRSLHSSVFGSKAVGVLSCILCDDKLRSILSCNQPTPEQWSSLWKTWHETYAPRVWPMIQPYIGSINTVPCPGSLLMPRHRLLTAGKTIDDFSPDELLQLFHRPTAVFEVLQREFGELILPLVLFTFVTYGDDTTNYPKEAWITWWCPILRCMHATHPFQLTP